MRRIISRPGSARFAVRLAHDSAAPLFDRDIDLTATATDRTSYDCFLSKNWSVGDAPNGGYLSAICLNAALKVSPYKHPLSLSTHFVSKADEGVPATVTVTTLNVAKSSATLQISLAQESRTRCVMIGTFGTIRKDGISVLATRSHAPLLPPPEKCLNIGESILSNFPDIMLARQFEFLTHRDVVLFDPDHPKSLPELEGWIRYVDTRPHDFLSCLFFLDCLPPPVGNIVRAPWFPTLEYTVHFWADPRDYSSDNRELLRCRFSSHHVENGSFYTDAELFSCDGKKLLAKSRQLARIFGAK